MSLLVMNCVRDQVSPPLSQGPASGTSSLRAGVLRARKGRFASCSSSFRLRMAATSLPRTSLRLVGSPFASVRGYSRPCLGRRRARRCSSAGFPLLAACLPIAMSLWRPLPWRAAFPTRPISQGGSSVSAAALRVSIAAVCALVLRMRSRDESLAGLIAAQCPQVSSRLE